MMHYQLTLIILMITSTVLLIVLGYLTWFMRLTLINVGLLRDTRKDGI